MSIKAKQYFTGVCAPAGTAALAHLASPRAPLTVVVARRQHVAEILLEDASFYSARILERLARPHLLSLAAPIDGQTEDQRFASDCDLLKVLAALANRSEKTNLWLAGTPESLRQRIPAPQALHGNELILKAGQHFDKARLVELLREYDYDNEALCEQPGQYSERGGLVDVYPLNASAPVRVDFFGDEIDSLREFDPLSQRTIKKIEQLVIVGRGNDAAGTAILERNTSVFEYFPAGTHFIFADADSFESFPPDDILKAIEARNFQLSGFGFFDEPPSWLEVEYLRTWKTDDLDSLVHSAINPEALGVERLIEAESARRHVLKTLSDWQREGERVVIVCETASTIDRLNEIIDEAIVAGTLDEHFVPEILEGNISAGFRVATDDDALDEVTIATEREIFGRNRKRMSQLRSRKIASKSHVEQLLDFNELVNGDYIVHLEHGVCIYRGIFPANPEKGIKEDMVVLEFDEKSRLYVPFRDAHLLSRYIGLSKKSPKLAKLGKQGLSSWRKTCRDAIEATRDFASEMLSLQARRQSLGGFAMEPDDKMPWLGEFEKAFPFAETPDQLKAINETKHDQERELPMDRLICGDVGFGKTEVAIRAAFKAVLSGYQVAILAPTTVLVQQHFNTFKDRFAQYPVAIEMLSRFRTAKQCKAIYKQIQSGELDIVIGTHALLSKNVVFKKLGLLVVDEEHRFGVKQKEQIKQMREQVDVLTMSATPIPRTLYMAIMGARDLSVIETAPRERLPIQTIIKFFDIELIRNVIRAELDRGGQVFYLHNRVETIYEVQSMLQACLPEVKIAVGHGQMGEKDLEQVMTDFVAGKYDVLVCTTIIETGLDIPNCNTLIIDGADRFGLSQLYQLRGRVGRFNRQAYAYLLLHRRGNVTGEAKQRLAALAQNTQLGAGFRIAMRDLELRGAGNILGVKQSGPIMGVGFELYCQLLRQSIATLKGEEKQSVFRAEMQLDFIRFAEPPSTHGRDTRNAYEIWRDEKNAALKGDQLLATIPSYYIGDTRVRIDIFRKIAMAQDEGEIDAIAESMNDRFGKLPAETKVYCDFIKLRCLAEKHGIVKLETNCGKIMATRRNGQLVQVGNSLPLLSAVDAKKRLRELAQFLINC